MIQTKKIALSELLKLEVPYLLEDVINILDKHDPEKLHLTGIYDLLLKQQVNAALLTVPYGAHALTIVLKHMHAKRLSYAAILTTKLRFMDKPCFGEKEKTAKTARLLVQQY